MKSTRAKLPFPYQMINVILGVMESLRMRAVQVDEQTLSAEAALQTGLINLGDPYFREGLNTLIDSVNGDAGMHPLGRFMSRRIIVNYLIQRLLFVETLKNQPDILEQPLIPPIIIVGLARSGTTFLHNLLALDPSNRAIPLWLLIRPFPEGRTNPSGRDPRQIKMDKSIRFRQPLLKDLDKIHYIHSDLPEECINLLGITFNSLIFPTLMPLEKYTDWYIRHCDDLRKYKEYGHLLQVFQYREPEKRLTLKAPAHTGNLDVLFKVIPDAMVVQTHRDPVTCYISACNLIYTFHKAMTKQVDIRRITSFTLQIYQQWLDRNLEFHSNNPEKVLDVRYDDILSNPIGVVRNIYKHFNLSMSRNYTSALKKFIQAHPKDKHGKHDYTAEDFDLREVELEESFMTYKRQFEL